MCGVTSVHSMLTVGVFAIPVCALAIAVDGPHGPLWIAIAPVVFAIFGWAIAGWSTTTRIPYPRTYRAAVCLLFALALASAIAVPWEDAIEGWSRWIGSVAIGVFAWRALTPWPHRAASVALVAIVVELFWLALAGENRHLSLGTIVIATLVSLAAIHLFEPNKADLPVARVR